MNYHRAIKGPNLIGWFLSRSKWRPVATSICRSTPSLLSVDVENLTGGRVDIDFHVPSEFVTSFNLPFITGEFGMRYRDEADVGGNVKRELHRDGVTES